MVDVMCVLELINMVTQHATLCCTPAVPPVHWVLAHG